MWREREREEKRERECVAEMTEKSVGDIAP